LRLSGHDGKLQNAAFPAQRAGATYGWKVLKATEDSPTMRTPTILFMLILLLSGCDGPRTTLVPRDIALKDERVMRLEVVKVYNNQNLDYTTEFNVSHVLDLNVLDGPPELVGKPLTLPFDIFYVAKPPPNVGETVVTAPADWVRRNPFGKARGFGQ
jgi:hypothetical protein